MPVFSQQFRASQIQHAKPVSAYLEGRAMKMAYEADKEERDRRKFENSEEQRRLRTSSTQSEIDWRNSQMNQPSKAPGSRTVSRPGGKEQLQEDRDGTWTDVGEPTNRWKPGEGAGKAPQTRMNALPGGMQQREDYINEKWTPVGEPTARWKPSEQGGGLKATDSRAIRSGVATFFGGMLDEAGNLRLTDPTVGPRISKISGVAAKIYQRGEGQIPHDQAVNMALLEYGENVPLMLSEKQVYIAKLPQAQQDTIREAVEAIETIRSNDSLDESEIAKRIAKVRARLRSLGINPALL